MTADRNGSRSSPTRSSVTWAATSAWTAAVPGWADSRWRSAARASASSGSLPSIYNHSGRRGPQRDFGFEPRHKKTLRHKKNERLQENDKRDGLPPLQRCSQPGVHPSSPSHAPPLNCDSAGGGACSRLWNELTVFAEWTGAGGRWSWGG